MGHARMNVAPCSGTFGNPGKEVTMNILASEYDVLLATHQSPCVSLYQPTHRRQPDRRQDAIRFRNLIKASKRT